MGVSVRTYERWSANTEGDRRKSTPHPNTPARLSEEEKQNFLNALNQPQYRDLPPEAAVAAMADNGIYYASPSTAYRLLRECKLIKKRKKSAAKPPKPQPYKATAPKQLWSWDITYMACHVKGAWYYLYLFIDIYSRKIVGYEIFAEESGKHAAELIQKTAAREKIAGHRIVLHSDNGAPMKGFTMQAMLEHLGIEKSYSRPHTSDDNAYSEALFHTLKNHPIYPENGFASIEAAREWTAKFVTWYNTQHRHSALQYLTPEQVHSGQGEAILLQRQSVYAQARQLHPERWHNKTRQWKLPRTVWLNRKPPHLPEEKRHG